MLERIKGVWHLRVKKSTDGGANWLKAVDIPNVGSPDKNHMTVDVTNSPYRNNIYVAYTDFTSFPGSPIRFSRSTNGGTSFSIPVNISGDITSHFSQGVNLAVGPNGQVYATWAIYDNWGEGVYGEDGVGFNKSLDGGASWQRPSRIFNIQGIRDWWTHKNPEGEPIRVNSFPSMAVDRSGGIWNGTIYLVWTDRRYGDPDILLSKSTDMGATWTNPIRVNNDTLGNGKDQWFPWITVNPYGVISIVFYDSRNDPNNQLTEVWVAQSSDGGQTFTNFRVSDMAFMPYPIPGTAYGYMGDYIGITSKIGKAYPCWMDNRNNGIYQVYTDTI
ncbi:MAG: exo-alpha-sialidase, partial [Deltaproteobacteria bacterium]|nr:exo-alpha-sialidase [Deltaproteobacteria bacterium]